MISYLCVEIHEIRERRDTLHYLLRHFTTAELKVLAIRSGVQDSLIVSLDDIQPWLFSMCLQMLFWHSLLMGKVIYWYTLCIKWTAAPLCCNWLIHNSSDSSLCFWEILFICLNGNHKSRLCATMKHLTALQFWNARHYQSGGGHLFLNQGRLCLLSANGGHEERPRNEKVWRFVWLEMSPGLSSAHAADSVTMTTLSGHCGKRIELQMPWGVCQSVFTNRDHTFEQISNTEPSSLQNITVIEN